MPCLGVSANAASTPDNLIDPDLRNWDVVTDIGQSTLNLYYATYPDKDPFYFIDFWGEDSYPDGPGNAGYLMLKCLIDDTELLANHSYTFSFNFCDLLDVKFVDPTISSFDKLHSVYDVYFNQYNFALSFHIVFGDDFDFNGGDNSEILLFEINKDNYTNFLGKTVTTSFAVNNYVGKPRVVLIFSGANRYRLRFTLADLELFDNDNTAAELKGIKGLLHSLYWDLFGGVCDSEDCPHSSEDNPHVDLLTRLFVPDEDAVTSWKDKLDKLLADHLGIIYDAVDFMVDFISTVRDVLSNPTCDITFPGIEFDLPSGQHVHLWDDTVVDFTFLNFGFFNILYSMYKLILNVICIFALIKYALSLWDKTMSN